MNSFVTGFPDEKARRLLNALLSSGEFDRVYLLVPPAATERYAAWASGLKPEFCSRLEPLQGEPWALDLGLSAKEYAELSESVDYVFHFSQEAAPSSDEDRAEMVNVGGARELVELARSCRKLKSFTFLSTAWVSGDRVGTVLESELSAGQSFATGVERSLATAEKLVRSNDDHLPFVIVRPVQVVGDAENERLSGPWGLISWFVTTPPEWTVPLPVRAEAPFYLVALDFVVQAAIALGRHPQATFGTFHLCEATPPSVRDAFELIARRSGRRFSERGIPERLTRAVLSVPGLNWVSKAPRAYLVRLGTMARYDTREADALLGRLGLECPPWTTTVERLVERVQAAQDKRARATGGKAATGDDAA